MTLTADTALTQFTPRTIGFSTKSSNKRHDVVQTRRRKCRIFAEKLTSHDRKREDPQVRVRFQKLQQYRRFGHDGYSE